MNDKHNRCSYCGDDIEEPWESVNVGVYRYNELSGKSHCEDHWLCYDCIPVFTPVYGCEIAYSNTQNRVTGGSVEREGEYPYVSHVPVNEFTPHLTCIGMMIQSVIQYGCYHHGKPVEVIGMKQATIDSVERITGQEYEVVE